MPASMHRVNLNDKNQSSKVELKCLVLWSAGPSLSIFVKPAVLAAAPAGPLRKASPGFIAPSDSNMIVICYMYFSCDGVKRVYRHLS